MKKRFFMALVAFACFGALTAQTANVRKVEGLDVYIYSTPSVPYEELYTVSGFWNWRELFGSTTLDNMVGAMVRNATKKGKKEGKQATGIIFTAKDKGVAIRLKS
jgi:methionine salvage enolase-phosphatase E1